MPVNITQESILEDLEHDRLPLPTLPEVAIRVRETVDDENASIHDICDIITTDAALSARIIQVANSALYRGLSTTETVHNAVTRMGLNTIKNLATSLVMKQLFQATNPIVDRYLRRSWKLSTDIAALSSMLAKSYTNLDSDVALLAGLTHSIGMSPILVKAESDPVLLNDPAKLENIIIGIYPAVGAAILKNWGFSDELVAVPEQHLNLVRNENGEVDFTDIVQIALIETVTGTNHPLAQVDINDVPAFHRIGMDEIEEIDISGGVEEVKAAIA